MSGRKHALSEKEIDEAVEGQADDESAWEEPVRVRPAKTMSLDLPSDLVVRAAFCARITRAQSVGDWLRRILEERVELEEAAFARRKTDARADAGSTRQHLRGRRVAASSGSTKGTKVADYSKRRT